MTELLARLEERTQLRRSRVVVPVAVLGAGLLVGIAMLSGGGPACDAAGVPADARWDAARRERITHALGAASTGVVAALDAYVRSWRDQRVDACRATHVRGEQSGEMLDLRMQCLDRRLGELDALATVLATGGATVATNAATATGSLIPLTACSDAVSLREVVPPPSDPRLRARVERVRDELTAIKAQLDTGRYAQGFAAVEPVAAEAAATSFAPVIAEAELLRGSLAWRTDHQDLAETALYQAIASGEAGRAADVTARAWLELLWFVSQERGQPAEALRLGRLAQGAVDRYAGDPLLTARLAERVGVSALDLKKLDDAEVQLQRSYDLRVRYLGEQHASVAASLQHLALLALERGDRAKAIERMRRAHAVSTGALGPEHPSTLMLLNALASVLEMDGQLDESLALLERGLAATERTAGAETFDAAIYRCNLGQVLRERGDLVGSAAMLERGLAIFAHLHGEDRPGVEDCRAELAETRRQAGQRSVTAARGTP